MARPVSISVGEISKVAKATVEKALAGHKAAFPVIPDHRIGFIPPHWWYGFVMFDAPIDKLGLADAQKMATEGQLGMGDVQILGVISRDAEEPRLAYLDEAMPATPGTLELAAPLDVSQVFR